MATTKAGKTVLIRLANCADEAEVFALAVLINRAFAVEDFFLAQNHVDGEQIRRAARTGSFLWLEQESELAGTVYCTVQGAFGLLGMLAVEPEKQRIGLGRLLVEEAEQFLKGHGCERAELRVVNLRTELLPFYRKLGYREMRIEPFPSEIPVTRSCHLIRMVKYL
jgi:GNAT superfamily N-acetyltransferase